jgi:hypothetical protein
VKLSDPTGRWFLLDDFIVAVAVLLAGQTNKSIWEVTWEVFKHSWSNTGADHFKALVEIYRTVKPIISEKIHDGEFSIDESVSMNEKGLYLAVDENTEININVDPNIKTPYESKIIFGVALGRRKRRTPTDAEIAQSVDESISKNRGKQDG